MGKSLSKNLEEYARENIKCRGYVEKYSFKSGTLKRRYLILDNTTLSYSKSKDLPVMLKQTSQKTTIDKNFRILYDDSSKKEICIECLNFRGDITL